MIEVIGIDRKGTPGWVGWDDGRFYGPLDTYAHASVDRGEPLPLPDRTVIPSRTDPLAAYLTMVSLFWRVDDVNGDPPEDEYGDVLPDDLRLEDPAGGTEKAMVQVRPYEREGRPVSGYTRHTSKLIGSAAQGAEQIADNLIAKWERELRDNADKIRDLKPGESLHIAGGNIGRVSEDTARQAGWDTLPWVFSSHVERFYFTEFDAGKVVERIRVELPRHHEAVKANWTKRLRGKLVNKRSDPQTWKALSEAITANEQNEQWQSFMDRTRVPDVILPYNKKGWGERGLDILTTAQRTVDDNLTHMNGESVTVRLQLEQNPTSVFNPDSPSYIPPKFHPGMSGVGTRDEAAVLRHEYAHSVWEALSDEQRQRFVGLLPHSGDSVDEQRLRDDLTDYAAESEYTNMAIYREIPHGYRTETFAEAVAVTTSPEFKRGEWAAWVGDAADFIDALEVAQ